MDPVFNVVASFLSLSDSQEPFHPPLRAMGTSSPAFLVLAPFPIPRPPYDYTFDLGSPPYFEEHSGLRFEKPAGYIFPVLAENPSSGSRFPQSPPAFPFAMGIECFIVGLTSSAFSTPLRIVRTRPPFPLLFFSSFSAPIQIGDKLGQSFPCRTFSPPPFRIVRFWRDPCVLRPFVLFSSLTPLLTDIWKTLTLPPLW